MNYHETLVENLRNKTKIRIRVACWQHIFITLGYSHLQMCSFKLKLKKSSFDGYKKRFRYDYKILFYHEEKIKI